MVNTVASKAAATRLGGPTPSFPTAMKIIYNKVLPFKGFLAINLFGVLFVRSELKNKVTEQTINHESIHTAQMKELLWVFFYLLYVLEWLYRLIFHTKTAYRGISFEREAYDNQDNLEYLASRKPYAMWKK